MGIVATRPKTRGNSIHPTRWGATGVSATNEIPEISNSYISGEISPQGLTNSRSSCIPATPFREVIRATSTNGADRRARSHGVPYSRQHAAKPPYLAAAAGRSCPADHQLSVRYVRRAEHSHHGAAGAHRAA